MSDNAFFTIWFSVSILLSVIFPGFIIKQSFIMWFYFGITILILGISFLINNREKYIKTAFLTDSKSDYYIKNKNISKKYKIVIEDISKTAFYKEIFSVIILFLLYVMDKVCPVFILRAILFKNKDFVILNGVLMGLVCIFLLLIDGCIVLFGQQRLIKETINTIDKENLKNNVNTNPNKE